MKTVSLEQVILFHKKIVLKTGGSDGIRDISLANSALNRAFTTFDGKDLYEDDIKKISVITLGLIRNHGFIDGNKRIGVSVMLLYLKLNNIEIQYTQHELVELGLNIAKGKFDENNIEDWIKKHQI